MSAKPPVEVAAELDKLPFEELIAKLEELVGRMENTAMPLEKMLDSYEYGCLLGKLCRQKLDGIEKRIEILVSDDGKEGEFAPFSPRTTQQE
ncbi:MAG: exodeoxyribonuclease VII small subunit [Victivallaceae bacterium]|nr:exodeoxyribonuclease VII small subunit [Victivallaceae bacterium]